MNYHENNELLSIGIVELPKRTTVMPVQKAKIDHGIVVHSNHLVKIVALLT